MKKRTPKQNNSIHLYLEHVAKALQAKGHTMQDVVKVIRRAEILPTMKGLKEVVWKPIQSIMYGKESTTELETHEVDKVYEAINFWLGKEFHIHVPFPSEEPDIYE